MVLLDMEKLVMATQSKKCTTTVSYIISHRLFSGVVNLELPGSHGIGKEDVAMPPAVHWSWNVLLRSSNTVG
jgi:hypothetical protein